MFSPTSFNKGQSSAEYSLIGALVLGLSLGALLLFGPQVSGMFAGMLGNSSVQAAAISQANSNSDASGQLPVRSSPSRAGISFYLTGNLSEDFAAIQVDLPASIQTMGANGTTSLLAFRMESTILELLAQKKIGPEQANLLLQLANKGHQIAEIEALIEDAAKQSQSDPGSFTGKSLNYQGTDYLPWEIGILIGWRYIKTPEYIADDPLNPPEPPGTVMDEFLQLYHQSIETGVLDDPYVRTLITGFASQIAYLGEVTETYTCDTKNGIITADQMETSMLSTASHFNSAGICTTGSKTDIGTFCK